MSRAPRRNLPYALSPCCRLDISIEVCSCMCVLLTNDQQYVDLLSLIRSEKSPTLNTPNITPHQPLNPNIPRRSNPILEVISLTVGQNISLASEVLRNENGGDGTHQLSAAVVAFILFAELGGDTLEAVHCVYGGLGGVVEFDGAGVVVVQFLGGDGAGDCACDEGSRDDCSEVHCYGCCGTEELWCMKNVWIRGMCGRAVFWMLRLEEILLLIISLINGTK